MKPVERLEKVNELLGSGFKSQAAKKDALQQLGRAYYELTRKIKDMILGMGQSEATTKLYWSIPMYLHHWKESVGKSILIHVPKAKDLVGWIEFASDVRRAVNDCPVDRLPLMDSRVETICRSIREIMELRKEQYARGLALYDLFGGLPVSANVHMVINSYGTAFLRAFYYLDGKLTPINVILAVMDEKASQDKKASHA